MGVLAWVKVGVCGCDCVVKWGCEGVGGSLDIHYYYMYVYVSAWVVVGVIVSVCVIAWLKVGVCGCGGLD